MSVEASREIAAAPDWPTWQGALVNGVYPLRRLLNGSDHSAVFLTECQAQSVGDAAIKIVPAERVTLAQLAHWRTVADLSHPRLVRLFDAGLCKLGGRQFLFVVMEYAEQTLSQVLGNRALTAEEAREMLPLILDALTFLHGKGLVHSRIKPANILVIGDQLKLASDSVRPAGEPRASVDAPSVYEPPEANQAGFSAAGDMWGLGVTLVEALTQRPAWPDEQSGTACLTASVPPGLVDMVRQCLSRDPAQRPSAADLSATFGPAPPPPTPAVPEVVVREAPSPVAPAQQPPGQRSRVPAIVATGILTVLVAVWLGLRLFHAPPDVRQPALTAAQNSSRHPGAVPPKASQNPTTPVPAPVAIPASAAGANFSEPKPAGRDVVSHPDQPGQSLPQTPSPVVHTQMPTVPRSALRTIHGHVKVAVLVIVDRSGTVVDARLKNPGPSAYFARLAKEAATHWTFASADEQDSREWLIRFEFTRGGVTGRATPGS